VSGDNREGMEKLFRLKISNPDEWYKFKAMVGEYDDAKVILGALALYKHLFECVGHGGKFWIRPPRGRKKRVDFRNFTFGELRQWLSFYEE